MAHSNWAGEDPNDNYRRSSDRAAPAAGVSPSLQRRLEQREAARRKEHQEVQERIRARAQKAA
ncbi:MAG: hypothetical protein ABW046_20745 [Actinoplanes sp.]